MQQIVNVASNEDKAELQAILDRQQAAFDAKMANVIAYEEKVNAFVGYQGKVNERVGAFTARLSQQVSTLQAKPDMLQSFLAMQFPKLRVEIQAVNANERQPN